MAATAANIAGKTRIHPMPNGSLTSAAVASS
jgi:hypothetical protein